MSENNIICPNCNTPNDADYSFCANCGAALKTPAEQDINGIPVPEVADYVGKNSEKYIPKFKKFARFGKAGWNWPVFLFSYLLNIPFVWFFYRKMYKVGAIVLAISLAITVTYSACFTYACDCVMEYFPEIMEQTIAAEEGYLTPEDAEELAADLQVEMMTEIQTNKGFMLCSSIISLIAYLKLGLTILYSVLADYWYYKKAMKDLEQLNSAGIPNASAVVLKGGTNSAAGVLSGIFLNIAQNLILIVPAFSLILTKVVEIIAPLSM